MNILKKNIFLILNIFLCLNVVAQQYKKPQNLPRYDHKKIHFGFTLGINELNFNLKKNSNTIDNDSLLTLYTKSQKGFNLGIVSNLRLGRNSDLRFLPTLSFVSRRINYSIKTNDLVEQINKEVESTFIEFPINLKFKSNRYNNGRAYLITGAKYSIDLASKKNIEDDDNELIKLNKGDLMYEIGFGIDFYLQYFKFSPEFKATFGLINMLIPDDGVYNNSIEKLMTRGFTLTFTFE